MFFSVVPKGHPGSWTSRSWTHTRVGNGCDPQNWKSHRESSDSAWRLWTRGGRLSQSGANQASCVLWLIPESCSWPVLEQCPAFCFSLCASPCPCSHTGPSSAFPELLSGPALLSSGSPASWWHFLGLWCLLCLEKGPSLEPCSLWWLTVLFSRGKEHFTSGLRGQRGAPLVFDVPVGQNIFVEGVSVFSSACCCCAVLCCS